MNISEAFPSKFLKASDLQGAEPTVTIDRVELEPVGRDKEMKAVLYFRGKEKGLVLNKTNANTITKLLSSGVTEEWEGSRIRLFATETQFGADLVDCIRVKAAGNGKPPTGPLPKAPPKAVAPSQDDDYSDDNGEVPF